MASTGPTRHYSQREHRELQHRSAAALSRNAHRSADPRDVYQQKKRNGTLLAALATIHSQCLSVKERQHTARQLHARLNQVFLRATSGDGINRAILSHSKRVGAFTQLVDAFHLTLKRHVRLKNNIVRRVLHHRMFSLQLRSIHHQLTAFLKDARADDGFPYDWREGFETALREDENVLHDTLVTVVTTSSFLKEEYLSLTTHQQMEVLLNVRNERFQTVDLSPVLNDCLKLIYRNLTRLFGWDLTESARQIPRWFVALTAVDFSTSRDLLTKLKPTYRGEIAITERGGLKRHLIAMKWCSGDAKSELHVDEKVQIMDAFLAKYGAIHHPNVLLVRGANYASGAPFVVRDYATQGTLAGHLARLKHSLGRKDQFDESLVWRLLADACEGLLYIHESGYATHGGLKGSNLLVNHRGRACIADCGMRVLRDRLDATAKYDEAEYVRWLAPEFLAPDMRVQSSMLADVYAFGMCVLEIVTGQIPWVGFETRQVEELKRANDTALPPQPAMMPKRLWRLIQKMCAADPIARLPLRQVYAALLELSRGSKDEVVPASIRIDPASVMPSRQPEPGPHDDDEEELDTDEDEHEEEEPQDGEPVEPNEFETESVSSFKTTMDIKDNDDLGDVKTEPETTTVEEELERELAEDLDAFPEIDSQQPPIDTFAAFSGHHSNVGIALQTNGQMKNAIEFLAEYQDSAPQSLVPHLQLLCAFAKEEAESIKDCGGIRVLNALFAKHKDAKLRCTTLEIYSTMLLARHQSVAEALVDQGVVALIFEFFTAPEIGKDEANVCVSLLLDLIGQSDQAKRQLGDAEKKYVELLEKNEDVHHRLMTEIKSVLARFKQAEGNDMLKEGFHAMAIQRFSEAIQLDRRRGIYYADRSLAYCHARRYHEAIEDAERCIRYNPFDAQGYLRLGIAMKHLKKYTEALAALRKGYQVNPNHAQLTAVMDEVQQLYNQQKAR